MKIGGAFLFTSSIVRGFILVLALAYASTEWITLERVAQPIIDFGFGVCLWQGRWKHCRLGAIIWTALVVIITGIQALRLGPFGFQYFNLIPQTTLCVALILLLIGESTHNRIWKAVGIFVVGYLGAFALAFLAILAFYWGLD